jgi:G3E family GTPase
MKPNLYLINGPLGAGKTTFLKELLKLPQYKNARIIENEFANTSVDTEQLHDHHAEVQTIAGVCICCSTGDELTDALKVLSTSSAPVIIEATGVANSLRLIEKIVNADMLNVYTLRHALFILDAIEAIDTIEDTLEMYRHELQAADTVLISKTDLLATNQTERLMDALGELNVRQVSFVTDGVFDASLLKAESHILDYFAHLDERIGNHEDGASYSVIDTSSVSIDAPRLQTAWEKIRLKYGLRRMKGNIQSDDGTMWHVEATPHQCKISPYESGVLRLVVIGKEATKVRLESVLERI